MLQPTPESTTLLMRSLIYLANKYPCEYFNQLFTIRSTVRKSCSLHSGSEVHSQTNPFTARVVGTVWEPWSMLMQLIHKRSHRLVSFNSGLSGWSTASHVFFNSLIAPFRTQWGGTLSSVAELAHLVSWLVGWVSLEATESGYSTYLFLRFIRLLCVVCFPVPFTILSASFQWLAAKTASEMTWTVMSQAFWIQLVHSVKCKRQRPITYSIAPKTANCSYTALYVTDRAGVQPIGRMLV